MKVLGIETSCDETAAAVVEDGRRILSNVVATQMELHARYGGIVPEVAARQHLLQMIPVLHQALEEAKLSLADLDAIAVTHGPGLAGSLLVGVNAAKALALSQGLPLIGVNHLEGHIYANWLEDGPPPDQFPLMCLITSGGHTDLILMAGHGSYTLLGRTRDDAAGEAFDKGARVLGLGFPGGPEVQRVAQQHAGPAEKLPRPWLRDSNDFSFSGLKTALLHLAQRRGIYPAGGVQHGDGSRAVAVAELAFAFQDALVEVMARKTVDAALHHQAAGVLLGGGVAANTRLREVIRGLSPLPVYIPRASLCTDNAAMIASAACFLSQRGATSATDLDVVPNLRLG